MPPPRGRIMGPTRPRGHPEENGPAARARDVGWELRLAHGCVGRPWCREPRRLRRVDET